MRIVFFGPPGVGKGTQASLMARRNGLEHISTGAIIRTAIKAETPPGLQAKVYVEEGRLVPDEVVREMAESEIAENDYDQFILDGYPRTLVQATWLSKFLSDHDAPLHAVISLIVPTERIVDRLSKRRVNRTTGESYHLEFKPPPKDLDESVVIQRADDKPDAIRKRLEVYWQETQPVVDYYRPTGKYYEIDGVGEIEEVYGRIEAVLQDALRRSAEKI